MWPRLHLLGLPRELRDQIYRYAIVDDDCVGICVTFGRHGFLQNIPALIRVSRQLRHETHKMFLEENRITFYDFRLFTCLSSKPMGAFKALCAVVELQRVSINENRFIMNNDGAALTEHRAAFTVSKNNGGGLEVEFENMVDKDGAAEFCGCRIERLARQVGDQDNSIIRFLEALRADYANASVTYCPEDEGLWSCEFDLKCEWRDEHDNSLLC